MVLGERLCHRFAFSLCVVNDYLYGRQLSMEMLAPKRELPIANAKCIGLKMVLGARLDGRTLMLNMVVGRGMLLTPIGEAIGIGVTALLSPMLSRFLYGVSRVDHLLKNYST
jgi:hypothetical protein